MGPSGHEDGGGAQGIWVQQTQVPCRPSPCQHHHSCASDEADKGSHLLPATINADDQWFVAHPEEEVVTCGMNASARALIAQASDDMSAPQLAAWQFAMKADDVLLQALRARLPACETLQALRLLERA